MEQNTNSEENGKKTLRRRLVPVLIAVVLSVAAIAMIEILADLADKRREEEKRNKKIEDLTIRSEDTTVTLTFPQCVYEGDATMKGIKIDWIRDKNAACDSPKAFFTDVIAASPFFYGVFMQEGAFVPAAGLTDMPDGEMLFFKDNHCFIMSFSDTYKVNYEKYFVELCEAVFEVRMTDGTIQYLTFPVDGYRRRELSARETTSFLYDLTIWISGFEKLEKFYGGMDAAHCYIDEAEKTIYVKLSRAGGGATIQAAKIVALEDRVEISFCTVNDVQAKYADAFGGK
ncbi:MAG: hypothetical protein II634_05160 [Lachnospiraceae bacterium]|nr:hypothetical protein [Lachnospiraceae bacterium]